MRFLKLVEPGLLLGCAAIVQAQSFSLAGRDISVHGFFQQGFAYSSGNNYLSMDTTNGSFAMTDGGLNISTRLLGNLRIGAQAYSRNVRKIGRGQVQLDWAFAEYRFSDNFGIRGGKVKTTVGLYNDTQDMEFLHTFALLPQGTYPTDLRSNTIAHVGGDIYGQVSIGKVGRVSIVGYGGVVPDDRKGGYYLGSADSGSPIRHFDVTTRGGDVRWSAMGWASGLVSGYSYSFRHRFASAVLTTFPGFRVPPGGLPYRYELNGEATHAFYADYQRGKLHAAAEYRVINGDTRFTGLPVPASPYYSNSWYVLASFRVSPLLELGAYYDEYMVNRDKVFSPNNGIRGPVAVARFDLTRFWNVKLEGHYSDGYGSPMTAHSFYPSSNPGGFKNHTNVLLVRTGVTF